MKATRILSAYSIPRDDQDFSPECISYIEEADETDILPEQFIASILTKIMEKQMSGEEAV